MTENFVTRSEFNSVKEIIIELKTDIKEKTKEQTKDMLEMRDSKIRTEIKLEEIQKRQIKSDESLKLVIKGITELKEKPFVEWAKLKNAWKLAIIGAIAGLFIPYVVGNYMTFIQIFK